MSLSYHFVNSSEYKEDYDYLNDLNILAIINHKYNVIHFLNYQKNYHVKD